MGIKRLERDADHSPAFGAKVSNEIELHNEDVRGVEVHLQAALN
jgi:hypothetical protein